MFADTHKIIAKNVLDSTSKKYELSLNEKNFVWGAALPDYHPKYRVISHYPDKSMEFVVNEISYLIFAGRFIDFSEDLFYGISNKIFSRKLGIISHFLADFVCRPHYENWTFNDSMLKHINYERRVKKLATDFNFKDIGLNPIEYELDENGRVQIKDLVRLFVYGVLDDYQDEYSMETDLNFAYSINKTITEFVLETIILYNQEKQMKTSLVFA